MKVALAKGTTPEDVRDVLDHQVIKYMGSTRKLDEAGIRKLIHHDETVRASYYRKIERLITVLIGDGLPAAFFGRKA
jgi:hypothetical protein